MMLTGYNINLYFCSASRPGKVIVSQDESIRDQVIRATNNQSSVEPAALHATEKIQRSIEEILIRHDWFYERRTNFYKNEGKPENRILSPLTIAAASTALLLKNPVRSSKLRQKHLRTTEAYQSVYSESFPMNAWPVIAALIRYSELSIIKAQKSKRGPYSGILSAWRGVLAYIAAVRSIGTYSYQHRDLISMDLSKVTEKFMDECWAVISQTTGRKKSARLTDAMMLSIANAAAIAWGIKGDWTDGRREIQRPIKNIEPDYTESEDFLTSVHNLLPPQPWKPGVHMIVAEKLDAKPLRVSRAIKTLIKRGALMEQVDGVVFDANGNEVFRDLDR